MKENEKNINECEGGAPGAIAFGDIAGMGDITFPGELGEGEPGSGDLPLPSGKVYKQVAEGDCSPFFFHKYYNNINIFFFMIKTFNEYIKESYDNLGFIKSRSNYYLINESQESKSQSEAKKLVMDEWAFDDDEADDFIRVGLRSQIPSLRDKQIGKFTLGITRMYINGEVYNDNIKNNINATLKLLTAHLNEYDRNLNGLSAEEFISKFKQERENKVKQEKQEINRIKFGVSDYEIVKIDSYNAAKKYYKYTNPYSRWCLTHIKDMYDKYTFDGINQIYFCLKHGFEDIEPNTGDYAPLDEYGLSMLSIIVNEVGELVFCTTRWNHENGGNDNAMNAVEISKVVNVNFYEVFKPKTKLKESPEKIFDRVFDFKDGYAKVELNKKFNIIDKNGEIMSDEWFDKIYDFEDGYAKVELNKKFNLIYKDGEIMSDEWFDKIYYFEDGYAKVELDYKLNHIDEYGEILSDEWFDGVSDFKNGYAFVFLNDKYNLIDENGEILSDEWFDDIYDFEDDYAKVELDDKYNLIDKNGEILSDEWFDFIYSFIDGYAKVELDDKFNLIDKNGEIMSDEWFDSEYEASIFRNNL